MTPAKRPTGLTLDTGALIAIENRQDIVWDLLLGAERRNIPIRIPAGVLAQAWRATARQAPISRLLAVDNVTVVPLTRERAFEIGRLCRESGHSDVIDVSVAVCARSHGDSVLTSDPHDIRKVDPQLTLIGI